MPQTSLWREYLELLDNAALAVAQVRYENTLLTDTESSDSQSNSWTNLSGSLSPMLITPPIPPTPIFSSEMSLDTELSTVMTLWPCRIPYPIEASLQTSRPLVTPLPCYCLLHSSERWISSVYSNYVPLCLQLLFPSIPVCYPLPLFLL